MRAPTRRGFGTTIIERSIPYELKGEAEMRYELAGVEARFTVPPAFVRDAPCIAPSAVPAAPAEAPRRLMGSVLVVEDNMIIALEAEELLTSLGATAVDMASSTREALRLIDAAPPARALLDVNLGSETSIAVARKLFELGIPYAFATGYGDGFCIPEDLTQVPVVKKPYGAEDLLRAFPA